MRRTALTVALMVFLSALTVTVVMLPDAKATTLYVGGGPMPYPTIQSAIENASSGDTIYVYSGTYYENVRVYKTLSLIGQSRDSTTIDGGWIGMTIYVIADWVNITGFTVTNGSAGVNLKSVENCRVANNRIENNSNGISVGSSKNTIISDNILSNRFGIFQLFSSNTTMTSNEMIGNGVELWGNQLEHWNTHTIDTSNTVNGKPVYYWKDVIGGTVPLGAGQVILANCTDVAVENQNVSNTDIGILLGFSSESTVANNTASLDYRGIVLGHSNRNTIIDNIASGNSVGIYLLESIDNAVISNTVSSSEIGISVNQESDNNTVDSNIALNNEDYGIQLEYADSVTVIGNTVSTNDKGIYLHRSRGSTIINNNASSNRLGIYLYDGSNDNTIVGNTVQSNVEHGISFKESGGNTIDNNTISWNNRSGVHLENSSGNTISNSNVSSNNQHGVHLYFSGLNTVTGNRISLNALIGIRLNYSASNDIVNNIVSLNSEWGVYLHSLSDDNNIYHNDFMNNTRQAYDDGFNLWDDGYPSGGNYWSDYTGLDLYCGPDQDVPGSDGIGDEPYVIDSDSQDNYPFTEPTSIPPPSPPKMTSAVLTGADHQDVAISWDLSSDDGAGLDSVVRYDIHRGAVYDASKGYQFYDSVPNGISQYVDAGAGEGDPSNHFYYVCALNFANNSSCSSNQAGKFTRSLSSGPNLVSIPLIQSNESIEYVLQTVEYDKAWFYDSSSQEWKWHMTSKEYRRGLWNVNHTMALWLNVTGNCNITVAGVVPAQTTIHLRVGWNLVSYPSFNSSYSVSDLKAEIGATRVEGYDLAPPNFLRVLGDAEVLQAGYGYWVRVEADTDWIVEVV